MLCSSKCQKWGMTWGSGACPGSPSTQCTPSRSPSASVDVKVHVQVTGLVAQSCPSLSDPMDCSPLDSSVHGILQARALKRGAISFSRGSSRPRDRIGVSCMAGGFFTIWAPGKPVKVQVLTTFRCNCQLSPPYLATLEPELKSS